MIQRIQSLYLFLSVVFLALALFVPLANYEIDGTVVGGFDLLAFSPDSEVLSLPVSVLLLVGIMTAILSIFQFVNRKLQMNLVRASMAFAALSFVLFGVLHYQMIASLKEVGELAISYSFTVVTPILAIIVQWLALKAIKKDDDKIRSVDRLR